MMRPRRGHRLTPRRTDSPSVTERLIEHNWSVMLYDGHCEICTASARFIAARSRGRLLAFSAMQSNAGRAAMASRGHTPVGNDTVVVLTQSRALHQGDAIVHLLDFMPAPWPHVARMLRRIPRRVRNAMYACAARARRHLTRRRVECMLLVPEMARRFVR